MDFRCFKLINEPENETLRHDAREEGYWRITNRQGMSDEFYRGTFAQAVAYGTQQAIEHRLSPTLIGMQVDRIEFEETVIEGLESELASKP